MINSLFIEHELVESGHGFSYEYRVGDSINWSLVHDTLVEARVISKSSPITKYKELTPWERLGSETYSCIFKIEYKKNTYNQLTLICKALTSFAVNSIEERANEWLERAHVLEANKIKTYTFGVVKGCVFQKYLPQSLSEQLLSACQIGKIDRIEKLAGMINTLMINLGSAGFKPISLLPDIRIEKDELVLADLGEDLGNRGISNSSEYIRELINSEFRNLVNKYAIRKDVFDSLGIY